MVGVSGIPGRHPGLRPRLWDDTGQERVLDRLGEAGLKLKAKQCQLFQEEIPFLGHIVSAAGIGADPTKCKQVRDWPVPRDLHDVRSFVGLCSYYRRHIQGFTELAAPLYELATKGTEFEWTDRRHEAFGQLKNALTSVPILGFPREDGLWYLNTDASDVGTGAVLSQVLSLPVRDASRRRRSPETPERRHEAGRSGCSFPLLSLPVRDASKRRRSQETTGRWHEAGRSGCSFPLLSLPVRDASRRRRGRDMRGWTGRTT